jgi:DNA-binding Xre family transcriptional regulator
MITNRLPDLVAAKGISIRQLARDTGVTYSTIWAMVHGRRRSVQLEVLDAVCEALNVQPGDIYQRPAVAKAVPVTPEKASRPRRLAVDAGKQTAPARQSNPDEQWRSW